MAEIELTPHVEEIKRVLENKVDEEVIVNELNKYLNEYEAADEKSKDICKRLIHLEESLTHQIRDFL